MDRTWPSRGQPRVIIAVGAAGAVLALIFEVIDVRGGRQVWFPYRKKLSRPGDITLVIDRVGPARRTIRPYCTSR